MNALYVTVVPHFISKKKIVTLIRLWHLGLRITREMAAQADIVKSSIVESFLGDWKLFVDPLGVSDRLSVKSLGT